jgi:hypothetical protein
MIIDYNKSSAAAASGGKAVKSSRYCSLTKQVTFLWHCQRLKWVLSFISGRSRDHENSFVMCFMGATTDDERFFHWKPSTRPKTSGVEWRTPKKSGEIIAFMSTLIVILLCFIELRRPENNHFKNLTNYYGLKQLFLNWGCVASLVFVFILQPCTHTRASVYGITKRLIWQMTPLKRKLRLLLLLYHQNCFSAELCSFFLLLRSRVFTRVCTYVQRGSKFWFVVLVLADTLLRIYLHYCPISPCAAFSILHQCMHPCHAAFPGSLVRQPCPAALPGSLARQPCQAALQKYYKFNNRP